MNELIDFATKFDFSIPIVDAKGNLTYPYGGAIAMRHSCMMPELWRVYRIIPHGDPDKTQTINIIEHQTAGYLMSKEEAIALAIEIANQSFNDYCM